MANVESDSMRHPAKFIHPGYGSFAYLSCGNSECESHEAGLADLITSGSFLIYNNASGQLRFQCRACGEITYGEDM